MRPVTTFPPGHANRDWGILLGITIRSARPREVLCFFPMSNKTFWMQIKSFVPFQSFLPLTSSLFFPYFIPADIFPSFIFCCHRFHPPPLCPSKTILPLVLTRRHLCHPPLFSPVNTVIARGARRCVTDLSTLVLFMAFSLFKFNQTSMVASQYHFNLLAGRHRIGER